METEESGMTVVKRKAEQERIICEKCGIVKRKAQQKSNTNLILCEKCYQKQEQPHSSNDEAEGINRSSSNEEEEEEEIDITITVRRDQEEDLLGWIDEYFKHNF